MLVFQSLDEVREQTEKWLKEYNKERPHDALGDLTPREYLLTQSQYRSYAKLVSVEMV
jgi:putative transposase